MIDEVAGVVVGTVLAVVVLGILATAAIGGAVSDGLGRRRRKRLPDLGR